MTQPINTFPPIGAILTSPHWPDRVRVVRVEQQGASRILIEAVTLDNQNRLISRLFRHEELSHLQFETHSDRSTLDGDPAG